MENSCHLKQEQLEAENNRLKRTIDEYVMEKKELQDKFVDLCHEKTLLEKDYKNHKLILQFLLFHYILEKKELQDKFVDLCHEKTLLEKDYKNLLHLNKIYLVLVLALVLLLWCFRLFPVQFFSLLTGQICFTY